MSDRRRQWGLGLAWVLVVYVLTVMMLIASLEIGDSETRRWVVLPVTFAAVALFAFALARVRGHLAAAESQQIRLRGVILVATTIVVVVGVVMFATALGGRNVRFVSLTVVVVGVSHLLSEYRDVRTRRRGRAVALAVICLSLSIGGVYWQSSHPGTGLLVAAVGAGFGYLAMVTASEQMWLAWSRSSRTTGIDEEAAPEADDDGLEGVRPGQAAAAAAAREDAQQDEPAALPAAQPQPGVLTEQPVTVRADDADMPSAWLQSGARAALDKINPEPIFQRWGPLLWAALGALAVAVALGLYLTMSAGRWGVGMAIVLAPVIYTVVRRGDVDLVLVVLIAGVWWAVSPASEVPEQSLLPAVLQDVDAAGVSGGDSSDGGSDGAVLERSGILLVFGDSFASGEGAPSYFDGTNERGRNECRRASTAHHHLIAEASLALHEAEADAQASYRPSWMPESDTEPNSEWNVARERLRDFPQRVISVACSGAVAANVTTIPQFTEQPELPGGPTPAHDLTQIQLADAYLAATASQVDKIMISIGGNDALFSTVVTTCLAPGDCSEIGQYFIDALDRLGADPDDAENELSVRSAYRAIAEHPWNAGLQATAPEVLVIPYPQPLGDESCIRLLSDAEHRFINDFVRRLNTRLAQLATEFGFTFVSTVETALSDGSDRLCDSGAWGSARNQQGLNYFDAFPVQGSLTSRVNPLSWVHNSFHPNVEGHELLARAILRFDPEAHDGLPGSPEQAVSSLSQICVAPSRSGGNDEVELPIVSGEQGASEAPLTECYVGETCRFVEAPSDAAGGEAIVAALASTETADHRAVGESGELGVPPVGEEFCEHPCDVTLSERGDPVEARDDCPSTWVMGELRNLAGATYWPNLLMVIGLWMLTTAIVGRKKNDDGAGDHVDNNVAVGSFEPESVPDNLGGDVIVVVWTVIALVFAMSMGSAWRLVPFSFAMLLGLALFVDVLARRAPLGGFVDNEEPLRVRSGERSDPFAGELRSWDRILREFRYQILGWIGATIFVIVVLLRAGEGVLVGLGVGVAFAVALGSALFPMVVSRPRQRSSQIALLSVVVFLAFLSGLLWPWTVAKANESDAGTIGRDFPLLAGGVLALALLVASAIVDGAVREKEEEAETQGTFGEGIRQWLRSVPDKGASQLHSAQTLTATGLLVAAIAAKQMDGVEAYASFALVVAVIIVNWWAIFLQEAGRLWPIVTTVVLSGTVAVELLLGDGWLLLGRGAMALLALFTIARVFSARTLRVATVLIAVVGALAVYRTGAATGNEEGVVPPSNFADAMRRGADEVWVSIFGGFGVDDPPSPGLVAFGAVAIGLVLVYRAIETTNGRRTLTPVTVEKFTAPSTFTDVEALTSQLQSELARAGIIDPPFVPSGGLPSDVISVFEGGSTAPWASAAKTLATLARPARGSVVIPTLEHHSDEQAIVTIRVTDARSGGIRYTASFHATTPRLAVRKAVAFVAQSTLGSSVTTPGWARWESDDGLPLRFYLESRASSHYGEPISLQDRIGKLTTAIAASPSTGLTRVDLGHVHELKKQPWRALRIHLEAADQHRRLVPAHYRAATGLSMLAGELLTGRTRPENVLMNDRIMIADHLKKVLVVHTKNDFDYFSREDLLCTESSSALRHRLACAFLEAADDLIGGVLRITSTPVLVLNAIVHQAERNHWLDLLGDIEARRRETGRYLVLRELVRVRLMTARAMDLGPAPSARLDALPSPESVREIKRWHDLIQVARDDAERIVRDYDGAGTRYNFACLLSVLADAYERPAVFEHAYPIDSGKDRMSAVAGWRAEAIAQLYASRSHPGAGFPAADWVSLDPDLSGLQPDELFGQLLDWMERGEADIAAARRVGEDEADNKTEGRGQWTFKN